MPGRRRTTGPPMALPDVKFDPPYGEALAGTLAFGSLAEAEATLRRLDKLCRNYRAASDKKGVDYCRQIAVLGRRRAEWITRNPRVGFRKRMQKAEIARWFALWLENPSLFESWLELRKCTAEYGKLLESDSKPESPAGDA